MKDLKNISKLCREYMQKDKLCNIDDFYLYSLVATDIVKDEGKYNDDVKTALKVLKQHYEYSLPSFITVVRIRSSIHHKHPDLRVCDIAERRKHKEELFYNFFKDN